MERRARTSSPDAGQVLPKPQRVRVLTILSDRIASPKENRYLARGDACISGIGSKSPTLKDYVESSKSWYGPKLREQLDVR